MYDCGFSKGLSINVQFGHESVIRFLGKIPCWCTVAYGWFWLRTCFVSHRQDENLEVSNVKIFWEDFVLGQICLKI